MLAEREAPRLIVDCVTVEYRGQYALKDVSLMFRGPSLVQVIGPNGAGKTTLLKTILGLVKPKIGRIIVNDMDVTGDPGRAGRLIGYVPQLTAAVQHYPLTLLESIELEILLRSRVWPRRLDREARERAEELLRLVGLDESVWGRKLVELSGGQLQRGMIARALAHNSPILLLDEPFSAIDPAGRHELAELIARLAGEKLVIVTSHNPHLLLEHTKTLVLLDKTVIAAGDPGQVLRPEILGIVYGKAVAYVQDYYILDEHMHEAKKH